MIYQLTYCSVPNQKVNSKLIENILETSRQNNTEIGITGCLVYFNNKFIQLLEGEEDQVMSLYRKIETDDRHQDLELIATSKTKTRSFADWGMAYYPIDEDNFSAAELDQFRQNLNLLANLSGSTTLSEDLFWKKLKVSLIN